MNDTTSGPVVGGCCHRRWSRTMSLRCVRLPVPKMFVRIALVLAVACSSAVASDFQKSQDNSPERVKRFWGISDNTALVGQIFSFSISKDAFTGKIKDYIISEAGESSLPNWLKFNKDTNTFQGLPMEKDLGQYYISVKAQGYGPSNVAKDVFSIDVVDDASESSPSLSSSAPKCANGEVLTVASILVDIGLETVTLEDRIALLQKAASIMKIPAELLKLKTLGGSSKMFDSSALMAGPGNVIKPKTNGAIIQWQVGCSGVVSPEQSERITDIEKLSKEGTLSEELALPVIGWHVTIRQPPLPKREKRQSNQISGTPVPGVFPTRWPSATEKIDEASSEESHAPESRIIPTMVSPSFTAPSHHHRHHHGDIYGREHPQKSVQITASPVVNQRFPAATPGASPMATPTLIPQRPSKYVPLSTLDVPGPSRPDPEEHTPTDGLQPSMVTPYIPVATTSLPIKPTKTIDVSTGATKKPTNYKPTIEMRMKKLSTIAGKAWSYLIPQNTFTDFEDGDTRKLKLMFTTEDRTAVSPSSWIQFDPEKQILYALPLDEDIGKYSFILEAMDSGGATVKDNLEVYVRQHPGHRAVHHIFTLGLKFPKWKFPVGIDWQIEVVKKLAKFYGDKNSSMITVRSVTLDPLRISWTNDSLPKHPCPRDMIEKLAGKLMKEEGEVSPGLSKIMGKEIKVEDASVTYLGVCHAPPVSTTQTSKSDSAPILRNPIEQINASVGEILRFKVPIDTFFDNEDGDTSSLTLMFFTIDSGAIPKSSWVQLDPKSQELYGLPFETDVGNHEFIMAAIDTPGNTVNDAFIISVHDRVPRKSSVQFSMHLDADYNTFSRNTSQKVLVAWKLSKLFGDPDPRYITVNTITKGSVVYTWTNNTLPHDPCPKEKISTIVSYLFNDNETISSKLVEAMQPEFRVTKVDAMPTGVCLGTVPPKKGTFTPAAPPPSQPDDSGPGVTSDDDDIYITTIIPAVVIAIMLIIAAMVACFLYRKKRKGKMRMNDNGTFVTKGIPIIFADELDDKSDPAKPPIILKEEKPPLAPIDYPRSISQSSRDSTPQIDRREVAMRGDNINADYHHHPQQQQDVHFSSPPYQPPPPFTTSSRDNKNSRPKATPTYRQPPPYVPP